MNQLAEKYYNLMCRNHNKISDDIYQHLPTLKKYSENLNHITEFGVRRGVSTWALLSGKPKKLVSVDLNAFFFNDMIDNVKKASTEMNVDFVFVENDTLKIEIEQTDLLFIDTLHTYQQLSKELKKHNHKVNKYIILHDTTTFGYKDETFYNNAKISDDISPNDKKGLMIALNEFLDVNKNWIIKEKFNNNNGLTILEKIN